MSGWAERCAELVTDTPEGVCGVRLRVDGHCSRHGVRPFAPCRAQVETGLWDERLGKTYTTFVDIARTHTGGWPTAVTYRRHRYVQAGDPDGPGPRRYVRADGKREGPPAAPAEPAAPLTLF